MISINYVTVLGSLCVSTDTEGGVVGVKVFCMEYAHDYRNPQFYDVSQSGVHCICHNSF